tara:strand:+ start:52 stop:489 length:438 start_codon:yes stop_codon:yes gene_type:complete
MLHAHSGLRWIVLLLLILVIYRSLAGWFGKKQFKKSDNIFAVLLVAFTHIQALLGLALYFMGAWGIVFGNMGLIKDNEVFRFWSLEHLFIMLGAVALITVGRVKSKKATTDTAKHRKGAMFYLLALLLIVWAGIIKPYALGRGWF